MSVMACFQQSTARVEESAMPRKLIGRAVDEGDKNYVGDCKYQRKLKGEPLPTAKLEGK
jgi:hypothetical protein